MQQFAVTHRHPALPGHFPGHPVVPGVVLISEILKAAAADWPALQISGIRKLKFVRQVLPDQPVDINWRARGDGGLAFTLAVAGNTVAQGRLDTAPVNSA